MGLVACFAVGVGCHGDEPPVDSSTGGEGLSDGGTDSPQTSPAEAGNGAQAEPGQELPDRSGAPTVFPLRVSASGRFLEDSSGKPFLINQASSWGLIQSLSTADAKAYLDDLSVRGFNAVMVSVISNDQRMPGDPPAWRGIEPFHVRWDFSKPNDSYFDHADEILKLARERGMLVTLVPSYLGFPTDPTQGWADELLSDNNSVDKSEAYGRYLGRRYRSFDNLIWVAGGDNQPSPGSKLEAHMRAVVEGIRAEDPEHLWTAHWNGMDTGTVSSENTSFAAYIDLDGYYAFNYALTYDKDLDVYMRHAGRPFFHLDMSYETEWGGEPEAIRRRAYDAILSGASGSSFNAGPDWYLFRDFRNMSSQGTRETQYWYRLFSGVAWQELVPDVGHLAITAGFGDRGTADYVCAAHTPDFGLIMAYLPHGGSVGVDLSRMAAEWVRVSWYDPTRGRTQHAAELHVVGAGTETLSAPSAASWVLLVEAKR